MDDMDGAAPDAASNGTAPNASAESGGYRRVGVVRVTPDVIRAIIGLTALGTPGVVRLGRPGGGLLAALGAGDPNQGVRVRVEGDTVSPTCTSWSARPPTCSRSARRCKPAWPKPWT